MERLERQETFQAIAALSLHSYHIEHRLDELGALCRKVFPAPICPKTKVLGLKSCP